MSGLPQDTDLSAMTGVQLLQLCFGENECILNFDRAIRVTAEYDILYRSSVDRAEARITSYRKDSSKLCELIGHICTTAEIGPKGELTLLFENASTLRFLVGEGGYESFQVYVNGSTYVG